MTLALGHPRPGVQAGPFDAWAQICGDTKRNVDPVDRREHLAVALTLIVPVRLVSAVVEVRLAAHRHVDGATDALHDPQQAVFRVEVGGRSSMGLGSLL